MMDNIKVDTSLVTSLSDEELEDVVAISNAAYLNAMSPAVSMLTGGKLELIPELFRAMTRCCLTDGECYIATEVHTRKILGSALWFPPGKQLWATDEARQASGFDVFFRGLDPATKHWWLHEYQAQAVAYLKAKYGPETLLDSWWLNNVSVLPEYQGNGIATSLLEKVLKKAAANEAIGCMTDTEKNAEFYKSLRFTDLGVFYMRHPADGSDVKVWGFKQYGGRA